MAKEQQSFMDWVRANHAQQPTLGGELRAMIREAAKDVNSTLHQIFFSQPTSPGEPGTPLVPTQAQVTKDMGNVHGYGSKLDDAAVHGSIRQQEKGMER